MILLDEFLPTEKTSHKYLPSLLQLLDRYPERRDAKYGHVSISSPLIVITSNIPISSWYPGANQASLDALYRRIDVIHEYNQDGSVTTSKGKGPTDHWWTPYTTTTDEWKALGPEPVLAAAPQAAAGGQSVYSLMDEIEHDILFGEELPEPTPTSQTSATH